MFLRISTYMWWLTTTPPISIRRSNDGSQLIGVGTFTTLQHPRHGSIKSKSGSILLRKEPSDEEPSRVSKISSPRSTSTFVTITHIHILLSGQQLLTRSSKKSNDFVNLFPTQDTSLAGDPIRGHPKIFE